MFAPPSLKKYSGKKQAHSKHKKDNILFVPPTKIHQNNYSKRQSISKIASIRTLPPFLIQNSQGKTNSNIKSMEDSQNISEIWKQQYQLFQTQNKNSITKVDQQLQDVLQAIRKQRQMIDMKICKLKMKLAQAENKHNIQLNTKQTFNKNDASTQIKAAPYFDETDNSQRHSSKFSQIPQRKSKYFEIQLKVALDSASDYDFKEQTFNEIEINTKINQNKAILSLLIDKLSEN